MIEPKVNGYRLKEFGAEMVAYSVGPCEFDDTYMLSLSKIIPVALSARIKLRTIKVTLDFSGRSDQAIALAISQFTAELFGELHMELPDGFLYWCAFEMASTPVVKAPWIQQVSFTFAGFRHLAKESFRLVGSETVYINGNVTTPLIVKVTPIDGATEAEFNGIPLQNMKGSVTIDGVYTTVLDASGVNKFRDTNMTEWPKAEPGYVDITVSGNAQFDVSYYPIFL